MAKKKKVKSKAKRTQFKLRKSRPGKTKKKIIQWAGAIGILKILAVVCVIAATAAALYFAEKYVKSAKAAEADILEFVNAPPWFNEHLKEKICAAAEAGGVDLKLDEHASVLVQKNIETLIAWLDNVQVQTTHDRLVITAQWRKPLAVIKLGLRKVYVDANLVVLDFVPMPELPIVEVKGLSAPFRQPLPGDVFQQNDLAAAVALLEQLDKMDYFVTPDKPLLQKIARIDVSNFNGREDSRLSHIILYTVSGTEIIWGAEIGTWQRHLEATDEEKLAMLYSYYKGNGFQLSGVKYINLRDPQQTIPQPIDRF